MLCRRAYALTLHAVDIGGSHLSRHQRVLREVFEVSAAQGIAVQVQAGAEDYVAAILHRFLTNGHTDTA